MSSEVVDAMLSAKLDLSEIEARRVLRAALEAAGTDEVVAEAAYAAAKRGDDGALILHRLHRAANLSEGEGDE